MQMAKGNLKAGLRGGRKGAGRGKKKIGAQRKKGERQGRNSGNTAKRKCRELQPEQIRTVLHITIWSRFYQL